MYSKLYNKVSKSCISFILDILDNFGDEPTDERILEEIRHMIDVYNVRQDEASFYDDEETKNEIISENTFNGDWKKEYKMFQKILKEYKKGF